jgi:hypothetical protein
LALKDIDGVTPLIIACKLGHDNAVQIILGRDSEQVINQVDKRYHRSPLDWACEYGRTSVVKRLLKFPNLDVNQRDYHFKADRTALHIAVAARHAETVKTLLDDEGHELQVEAVDASGNTPLDDAIRNKNADIAQLLFLDRRTSLHSRLKCIKTVLSSGLGFQEEMRLEDLFGQIPAEDPQYEELLIDLAEAAYRALDHEWSMLCVERLLERPITQSSLNGLLF